MSSKFICPPEKKTTKNEYSRGVPVITNHSLTWGPNHNPYAMLQASHYHGDHYCRHYVATVVTCTQRYIRFMKRGPDLVHIP